MIFTRTFSKGGMLYYLIICIFVCSLFANYCSIHFEFFTYRSADGNYGIWKSDVQEKWYIGYWDSRGQRRGFAMSEMPGKSEGSDCPLDSDSEDWVYTSGGNWYNGKKSIKPWCV